MVLTVISDLKIAALIACSMNIGPDHHRLPIVKMELSEAAIRVFAYGSEQRHELIMHDGGKTVLREGRLFDSCGVLTTCYADGRLTRHFVYTSKPFTEPVKHKTLAISQPAAVRHHLKQMASSVLYHLAKLQP